jgi:xanthosine utilization system XapX-like protein
MSRALTRGERRKLWFVLIVAGVIAPFVVTGIDVRYGAAPALLFAAVLGWVLGSTLHRLRD